MDMNDYSGPIVAVLVRNVLVGRPQVDSVHPDEDEAAFYLGREIIAGRANAGIGWEVSMVPAPILPDALGSQPTQQPEVEPAGVANLAADQVMRQCVADLAAALGLSDTARPADHRDAWVAMCDAVRNIRSTVEDDQAERVKVMNALHPGSGTNAVAARVDLATWAELREQIRVQRERSGESFVAALRDRLAPVYGPAAADGNRPALLGMVTSVVAQVARLLGDDPERVQLDSEGVERALRAHWTAHRVSDAWDRAPEPDRERERLAVERIVRAYLTESEG